MIASAEIGLNLATAAMEKFKQYKSYKMWHINGSVPICGKGNDIDVVVLVDKLVAGELNDLYEHCGGNASYGHCGKFDAYRDGDVNIILVEDSAYYHRWIIAREVCRKLGYFNRNDRVELFQMVVDAQVYNGVI